MSHNPFPFHFQIKNRINDSPSLDNTVEDPLLKFAEILKFHKDEINDLRARNEGLENTVMRLASEIDNLKKIFTGQRQLQSTSSYWKET